MPNLIPRIEFGVQARFRTQRLCPFCEGRNHSVVARKHGVVRIRRCQDCFLYFTDPIYQSHLGDLYESLYRAEGSTTTLPSTASMDSLRTTTFSASDKNCAPQLAALMRLTDRRSLLEIGSSWGYFLYQATGAGFSAVGVEPGRTRREFGVRELGMDIRDSMNCLGHAHFDIIYCAHTLEHISEIGGFFRDCFDRLNPSGLLVIEVPHFDLLNLGKRVLSTIGAVHPLGLSKSFFSHALPKKGFRLLGVYDTWTAVPSSPMSGYCEGVLITVAEKTSCPPR
jgi:SAM-dependent methyltransferase